MSEDEGEIYLRELVEVGQKEYRLRLKGKSRERFNVNPFFRILSPGYPSAFTSRFFLDADRNINDGEAYKAPAPPRACLSLRS